MMRSHEKLVKANHNMCIGNHQVVIKGTKRDFIYFRTVICAVDDEAKTFHCDNGGWNTPSTNRAIGSYRSYFRSIGYDEV